MDNQQIDPCPDPLGPDPLDVDPLGPDPLDVDPLGPDPLDMRGM